MKFRLKLKSNNVFYEDEFKELEIGIRGERIRKVGEDIGDSEEVIDLEEKLVLPGVIDGHVHFRDPGDPEKEDFRSGSEAAAAGGVTTVVDMPNNKPAIKSRQLFEEKKEIARRKTLVNFALYSGIPESISRLGEILDAGAIGFKYYMATEELDLPELYREVERLNALLTVHAETPEEIDGDSNPTSPEEYLDSRPDEAELEGVRVLLNDSPARLHVAHVTLPESVSLLKGKATTEVTPHHLMLCRDNLGLKDFTAVTHPPIRKCAKVKQLQELFLSGSMDLLASDHAPHRRREKKTGKPENGRPGIPGVETLVPLSLTFAEERGVQLAPVVKKLTENPARLFRFEDRGKIEEGYWADITVVDPEKEQEIRGEKFYSRAKVTPFEGVKVSYWPVLTLVNGTPVFQDRKLTGDRTGKFLTS